MNTKTRSINRQTLVASALALSVSLGAGLVAAQTTSGNQAQGNRTPTSPTGQQSMSTPNQSTAVQQHLAYRDAEHAARALEGATRKAYQLDYKAQQAQGTLPQVPFLQLARTLLSEAQTGYAAGEYFIGEKKAKAADELFKAAESVYQAVGVTDMNYEIGGLVPPAPMAGPVGPAGRGPLGGPAMGGPRGGPALGAPYRAAEELQRLTQELEYYRAGDARVMQLRDMAETLLEQSQTAGQTLAGGDTDAALGTTERATSYADAASDVAKAARQLIEAARGF